MSDARTSRRPGARVLPPPLAHARQRLTWRGRLEALRTIPRLLRLVLAAGRWHFVLGFGLRLVSALTPVTALWVAKLIVDRAVIVVTRRDSGVAGELWTLFGIEIALAVAAELLARATEYVDSLLVVRVTDYINVRIMRHACRVDLATIEDPAFHDKLERARTQTAARLEVLAALGRITQHALSLLSYAGGVLWFSSPLFGLLTVSAIPVLIGEMDYAMRAYLLAVAHTAGRREVDYLRYLGASQQTAKEVRAYGLERHLIGRYIAIAASLYTAHRGLAIRRAVAGSALAVVGLASYYLAYWVVLTETLAGRLSIGDMTFLAGTFLRSRAALHGLVLSVTAVADQALFLTDLFAFLDAEPRPVSPQQGLPVPRRIARGLEFRNVSFQYAGRSRPVLRNLSFRMEPGECVALVGANGAGKTTVVKLITRLYDPTEGVMLLDGVDLREYDCDELRRAVGVIFQDCLRFDMPARDNIGLGDAAHASDLGRVKAAAASSHAAELIARLPLGYDQMLGRRFEGGLDLSGGEWQRIGLARAYMRSPQILILDEPTASLDPRTEAEVFRRLAERKRHCTTLLISHRFATTRTADRILVLERGEIQEQGTHGELLETAGSYAELFKLQAQGYR